ncbi:MAG: class I SAM-dependent methyltransferase [Nitrospirae bacterium]|nr:class I SAM-dependent methyltransferase [Nitrospirota bacterium]
MTPPYDKVTSGDTDQTEYVAKIFNEMAGEYDNLKDLWYSYTFEEIERIIRISLHPTRGSDNKPLALDVGCGTGIQSLVLAQMGYRIEGIDIADDLISIAKAKLGNAGFVDSHFQHADARSLPFDDNVADFVNCCGPTLSFVTDWRTALREISRCLKPGGKLLLEVEGKWTLDMFWEVINAIICNRLGYDKPLGQTIRQFLPPWRVGHFIDYSFVLESGETVRMHLKLFTAYELKHELEEVGLVIEKRWGLHFLTNFIPSTILHRADTGPLTRSLFHRLATIERRVFNAWPFNALGCSLLVIARKKG